MEVMTKENPGLNTKSTQKQRKTEEPVEGLRPVVDETRLYNDDD